MGGLLLLLWVLSPLRGVGVPRCDIGIPIVMCTSLAFFDVTFTGAGALLGRERVQPVHVR
jgi:hypothetical protein